MTKALQNKESESYPFVLTDSLVKGREKDKGHKRKVRNHKKHLAAGALWALNDGFLSKTFKILFTLYRVLLDLWKCILNGALKFVSVRSS